MAGIYSEACISDKSVASNCVEDSRLYQGDLISINDLSLDQIHLILDTARKLKGLNTTSLLKGKLIASCFFEPSTRTRLSFEAAVLRLGGQLIGFSSVDETSVKKGESLQDSMRVVGQYADLVVIRHPNEGAARLAADVIDKPVINAGDGANQHPTQTLLDLFTINECQNKLDGLSVALVGDLKHGRTIHSFLQVAKLFDMRLYLVSPENLSLPHYVFDDLKQAGVRFSFHQSIEEVIPKIDILYMTRVQQERMNLDKKVLEPQHILTVDKLRKARPNLKILHPLPRLNEIDISVDKMPQAHYFDQAANGICVRQAILSLMLNKDAV